MDVIMLIIALFLAYLGGRLVQKLNLPAILGWLIVGIIVGPNVLNILSDSVSSNNWFNTLTTISQMTVGMMIGSNLEWAKIKKVGSQVLQLSLWHIASIFILVSAGFGLVFYLQGGPWFVPFFFGLVAIASAPAPILSMVNEYETDGPLTKATIPMTVMNSVLATAIFFTIISIIDSAFAGSSTSILLTLTLMLVIPILTGFLVGWLVSKVTPKNMGNKLEAVVFVAILLALTLTFIYIDNNLYPEPLINYILAGISFAAGYINFTHDEVQEDVGDYISNFQMLNLMFLIMTLSAPLDPSLLLSAGIWAIVYVALRLLGSWLGAFIGGKINNSHKNVQKYLGVTMSPHSGIALVNTSVAAGVLSSVAPDYVPVLQTIIPAAAVINEIIAILISQKAYEWTDEIEGRTEENQDMVNEDTTYRRLPKSDQYYQNKKVPKHTK